MQPPIVELRKVGMRVGEGSGERAILRDVDLVLLPGELVAIMGPSGSGKSTLLSLVGGLATPTSGEVLVAGDSVGQMSRDERARLRLRTVGYVFQEYNLIPALTAAENVAMPLELAGVVAAEARARAEAALEATGMVGMGHRFPDELSGGERQRVAIARATVGEGRIVLADEPTGALDSATGAAVMTLLRTIASAGLVVTHNPQVAEGADRVVHLRDGCLADDPIAPAIA